MFNTGLVVTAKAVIDRIRYGELSYKPRKTYPAPRVAASRSRAWVGLEKVIPDIIEFSGIGTGSALEFGVESGYSTSVLSNYFTSVKGVDIFTGDDHAGHFGDVFEATRDNLAAFPNIELIRSDYRDYIASSDETFDLIHVDIIHTYEDTFSCGLWSAMHSRCTIFHDTQSFPDVKTPKIITKTLLPNDKNVSIL